MGILGVLGIGFLTRESLAWAAAVADRKAKYNAATQAASYYGKPLLVVGGPSGGNAFRAAMHMTYHGCGDVCSDIDPRACAG